MDPSEFKRLVENVRTDGVLTSMPLCCLLADGALEILSGHHRTAAAIEAELAEIQVICITTPLDDERKVALQLSHNAIAGKDDPSLLAELYDSLGLDGKIFSGLTDDVLNLDQMAVAGLTAPTVKYEELRISFLPEDRTGFEAALVQMRAARPAASMHLARFEDFDALFEAILTVKEKRGIANSGLAFVVLAELAMKQLAAEEPTPEPAGA